MWNFPRLKRSNGIIPYGKVITADIALDKNLIGKKRFGKEKTKGEN